MASDRLQRDPRMRGSNTPAPAPVAARPFVHLRVHSAYSLLEGALPLKKIVGLAVKDGLPAIAVTDTNNLFGALEFAQYASKEGVQPIIGCQLDVEFGDVSAEGNPGQRRQKTACPLVLLAATETGYANLVRIVSRAYLDNPPEAGVQAPVAWLAELAEGASMRSPRSSATGSMSSCSGRSATTAQSRRRRSNWPTRRRCRSSPPTRPISRRATISRRTTR